MPVHYFYVASLAFTIGICARTFLPLQLPLLLLGAVFVGALLWRYQFRDVRVVLCVGVVALSLGVIRMDYGWSQFGDSVLEASVGESVTVIGEVVREPEQRERTLQLYLKTDSDVVLVFADRYENIKYGDVVEVSGTLKKPDAFVTDLGRTFNYPGYLLARGVEYTISFPKLVVLESGQGNLVISSLLSTKESFVSALATILPEPELGLGIGLLLGVKQGLGEDLEAAFRTTGIIHIVVLSGYNILLVVTFVNFLLSFFCAPKVRLVCGVLAIIGFALLVGLSATVVRACIMAALCLFAQTFGRTYEALRGLMFAGVVMLALNPFLLVYDVGFQLSFLATLGLILGAPHGVQFLERLSLYKFLKEFLVATIVTQIAVLPLLLYQIGELSLVAVVVNMLVLPAVPFAMLVTFLTGLVALFSPDLAMILVFPTYLALLYIIAVAQFFASIPYAAVAMPLFPFGLVPLAYAFLGYWWYRLEFRKTEVEIVSMADWTIVEQK